VSLPAHFGCASYLLEQERIYVNHAVLQQMQRQHTDLVILTSFARQLSRRGEEHEIVGAVPLLDHVKPIIDLAAQGLAVKILAQKDRLDGLTCSSLRT
jgi:hypothetical protein